MAEKPRLRVRAGSDAGKAFATDSFQNFSANLGYGTNNLASQSSYGFNPISRNHVMLEWMYRGSWLVKNIIDVVADDMTREGITLETDLPPDEIAKFEQYLDRLLTWQSLNAAIKWGRLYGGCIAVLMIDGQKLDSPLRADTVGKGQFRGLMVLDRWMLWPHVEDPVTDFGPDFGLPKYYEVVSDASALPRRKIHHTRCLRLEGVPIPYWQSIAENRWTLSVLEPIFDRLIAFDSATAGAAQLVYRAHLRTLKIEKLRELIAFGGEAYQAVLQQMAMIRLMQSNEGLTVLDSTDDFEAHSYAFGGLSDVLNSFAIQVAGGAQIPAVRLYAQSPAGLNATGDSDIRNYYDAINAQQESRLRRPLGLVLEVAYRSLFGRELPEGFDFSFNPLWQMTDSEKSDIALKVTQAVSTVTQDGLISQAVAMKELRQSAKITGVWSNITDEDIEAADADPPDMSAMMQQGAAGGAPGQPGAPKPPGAGANGQAAGDPSEGAQKPFQLHEKLDEDGAPILPINPVVHALRSRQDIRKHFAMDHGLPENQLDDCLMGPDPESTAVWVVHEQDPETQEFGEFRVILGTTSRDEALQLYSDSGRDRIGSVHRMGLDGLRAFMRERPVDVPTNGHGE